MKKDHYKSGFVSIIGVPNVGKSTLLNQIAGQKIAIISDKPQTTRNKILAIHTTDTEQIVFTDTPGIHKPHNRLGEYMVRVAKEHDRYRCTAVCGGRNQKNSGNRA